MVNWLSALNVNGSELSNASAVVATEIVAVCRAGTCAGVAAQPTPQDSDTVEAPPTAAVVTVNVAVCPASMVCVLGDTLIVKLGGAMAGILHAPRPCVPAISVGVPLAPVSDKLSTPAAGKLSPIRT